MALRFYICDVVGAGTFDNPFRPTILDVVPLSSFRAVDGRLSGTQTVGRMLLECEISDADHVTAAGTAGITYIPFEDSLGNVLGLDDPVELIESTKRNQIKTVLENHHVPLHDLTLADPIRVVVRRIIQRLAGMRQLLKGDDWTEGLDTLVGDMNAAKRQRIRDRLTALGFDMSVIANTDTIREALEKLRSQPVKWNVTYLD